MNDRIIIIVLLSSFPSSRISVGFRFEWEPSLCCDVVACLTLHGRGFVLLYSGVENLIKLAIARTKRYFGPSHAGGIKKTGTITPS
jgi:hypothetical protein